MNLVIAPTARKMLKKLPQNIQKKAKKQFNFLLTNYKHPSLHARKMSGHDHYEARIDRSYRFTFQIEEKSICVLAIGPHDTGLGKK